MSKWILPEDDSEVKTLLTSPKTASPKFIFPEDETPEPSATPQQEVLKESSSVGRFMIGAGQRLNDLGLGVKQNAGMIRNLFPGDQSKWPEEVANEVKSTQGTRQAIGSDHAANLGIAGSNLALSLASPSAKLLPSMATGAVLEGATLPSRDPTLGNLLTESGKGALLGGTGNLVGRALTSGVAKAKNATQGRYADPEFERRTRIFKQNQVPASLGDITQNPSIMGIENMAQHIPASGRKQFLAHQAARLADVVEGAPEKIAGVTSTQSKEAIGDVLERSIKTRYKEVKDQAKGLYDNVETKVQAVGNPPIVPTKMATEVNALLSKYPSAFAKLGDDPDTVNTLTTIATGLKPGQSALLGANGIPIPKPVQLTFSELRQLDSDLGSMIRQGRQLSARGEMNNKSFDQLVKVQKALRDDITDWSVQVGDPDIAKGVAAANSFFREKVTPFRKNQLTRKVIQDAGHNPDQLADSMFKLDSPYLSEKALQFLTPEGVQAGRFHLLKQAEKKAMDEVLATGYSPSKFLRGSKLGETGPKLFSPEELGNLADLQELIRSSRRASSFAADPATGNRLLGLAPLVSWKAPAAARAFSTLSQSENPMKFMLANPNLYTGSGGLGKASENLLRKSGAGIGASFDELKEDR